MKPMLYAPIYLLLLCGCTGAPDGSSSLSTPSSTPVSSLSSSTAPSSDVSTASSSPQNSSTPAINSSSTSVSSSSAALSLTLQETQAGFCQIDGVENESENSGFSGSGYANTDNAKNTQITWQVEASTSATYTVEIRFANGGITSRSGELMINEGVSGTYNVELSSTTTWTSWATETLTVDLIQGTNTLTLTASSDDGLANIDYIKISGAAVTSGTCGGLTTSSAQSEATSSSTSSVPPTNNCDETSGTSADTIYYVAPNASGNGTSFDSAMNISTALSAVKAGEMILMKPGTYTIPYKANTKNTLVLSKSGTSNKPIKVVAANCGRAVFDFSFPEQAWVQDSFGFDLSGSYWFFKGIEVTRAGYQGVYVKGAHNTFENSAFHNNRNTGFEINKGGSYTTVINSDAYRNYDPKKDGSMADGFGPKQTQGPGNTFKGCRAWENSDDGFDLYDSPEVVIIEDSWAFRNGVDVWQYGNFSGNGNGFKLGGNRAQAKNEIYNSIAFGNPQKGFDQNNNADALTVINNTAYQNGTNYGLGNTIDTGDKHYLRNNISLGAGQDLGTANAKNNTWDSGLSVSSNDFISLDLSKATVTRNPDGSLPNTGLFRLKPNSPLIDVGSNEGRNFNGNAPDIGALETE